MDKKELLRRWTLGYVEPSLFYLPQRKPTPMCTVRLRFMEMFYVNYTNGMWKYTVDLTDRAETIIGAIFSIDNKFVSYVTPNYTDVTFLTTLKKGTYIFKEAVSPKGCLLAEDTVFSVDNTYYQVIQIKHKRNGFVIKLTREESEDHNTDFRDILDDDRIDIIKSEITIGKRHNIFINYLSLYDNSVIRKIEDAYFFDDYRGLIFGSDSVVWALSSSLPYENSENGLSLLHKQNQFAERTYIYQYLEESEYELYRRTVANLLFYNDDSAPCSAWWKADDINTDNLLYYNWNCHYSNGIIAVQGAITGRLYVDDAELSEEEDFLVNLTEEKLKQIYEFAIKNCTQKHYHDSSVGNGISYSVYVNGGNYYPEMNESTGYEGFFISVVILTTIWSSGPLIYIPVSLLLSDSKNISQNDLFDTKELVSNGKAFDYNYRRFFITDYKTDISSYFHGVNPNMTNTEMFNNPLIKIYDGYNDYGIQVFTQEFTNEKLLAEINSYIKDGD